MLDTEQHIQALGRVYTEELTQHHPYLRGHSSCGGSSCDHGHTAGCRNSSTVPLHAPEPACTGQTCTSPCVHICACTLVGGSQPLKGQNSADSFSQLLNFAVANYSYPKGRNTMIQQLCLSRARKHVAQQEALILDTGMEKSNTLPLLPMTAGGGRTQKLCAPRQPRGDVRLLPLPPSLLITAAESLSHSELKGFIMHPGNKTTGGEGGLLEAICSKTNHKSDR